jgi:hypothetical protein
MDYNRRVSDQPDAMERIVRVEDAVASIKDSLQSHIEEETMVLKDMAAGQLKSADAITDLTVSMAKLAVIAEKQDQRAERQDARADKQDARFERLTNDVEKRLDNVENKVSIIWTLGPIAVMLISGFWAAATHFKWF